MTKPKTDPKPLKDPKPPEDTRAPGFYVAEGREITSRRGKLSAGTRVLPRDFFGKAKTIDDFVKSGHIEEVKKAK